MFKNRITLGKKFDLYHCIIAKDKMTLGIVRIPLVGIPFNAIRQIVVGRLLIGFSSVFHYFIAVFCCLLFVSGHMKHNIIPKSTNKLIKKFFLEYFRYS